MQDKLNQFDEFFSIKHKFTVNIEVLNNNSPLTHQDFLEAIPLPFKLAGEVASIDQSALRSLQGLASHATQLVDYLQHQANKIDMLVGYILSQQDHPSMRFEGTRFGGGGIVVNCDESFSLNDKIALKIFLLEHNSAVYCHGEVIEITPSDDGSQNYKIIFEHIREQDREILVRTSLHQQSKQLQALAQERNQAAQKTE